MNNPNSKGKHLQRRKSLPGPLRSIHPRRRSTKRTLIPTSKLVLSKSNPYVGWFRHSPPVQYYSWIEETVSSLKKKRHIAKSSLLLSSLEQEEQTKALLCLRALKETFQSNTELQLKILKRNGFLPGGATEDEDLEAFLKQQCKSDESSSLLFKLVCWFLDVPAPVSDEHSFHLPGESSWSHENPSAVSDDESEGTEYDNYDTAAGSRERSRSLGSFNDCRNSSVLTGSVFLSSQAEAYTAYTAVRSLIFEYESDLFESLHDRLDYNITQMDIVRMNRAASRHLDVESIMRLPVVTFKENDLQKKRQESKDLQETIQELNDKKEPGFSWMLVRSPIQEKHSLESDGPTDTGDCIVSEQHEVCVICLEPFIPGDRLRIMPCTHSFHVGCIDRWLSGAHSFSECYTSGCPTCKRHPTQKEPLDGSVPSWAFTQLGSAMARESHLHEPSR